MQCKREEPDRLSSRVPHVRQVLRNTCRAGNGRYHYSTPPDRKTIASPVGILRSPMLPARDHSSGGSSSACCTWPVQTWASHPIVASLSSIDLSTPPGPCHPPPARAYWRPTVRMRVSCCAPPGPVLRCFAAAGCRRAAVSMCASLVLPQPSPMVAPPLIARWCRRERRWLRCLLPISRCRRR